nr:ribonuclease H-like domain-containing protein [Tanacetum cinerariifolium]
MVFLVVLLRKIKSYLIKDCDVYDTVDNFPSVVSKAASVPAGSRNSLASTSAGRSIPAASRNRPASIHADRSIPAANRNRPASIHADRHIPADIGIVDSGCSRSMIGNKEKLDDFVQVKGGTVTFRGGDGKIIGKGTIRTSKLNFKNVYYVEELQNFNLFFVSQICDKKNKVLFTDYECLVLAKEFQLPDESQVVLRIPRRHDLYTFNLSDIQPEQHINCLLAKASLEESTKWHRRMALVNFKTINKLAKNGLVECLPLKLFTNEYNCVACNKGKQHKASYKAISALNKKVKAIRCDNGIEFRGAKLIALCEEKGIKEDYSNARSPQQNEGELMTVFLLGMLLIGLGQEWYFDLDYLTDSLGYTRFKTNPPVGTHDTNIISGTQDDDSESECDEQVILVPFFPSNSFSGPKVHNISAPMENNLDYAEELARLQRQEHEAHSAAAKYGFEFSDETTEMLHQAEIETRRNMVLAAGDPTGSIVSTSSVPAGSVLASH